jgi:hypothetical protein
MAGSHDSHAAPPQDEPKTPMWLPALGAALFLIAGIVWATRPPPPPPASAEDDAGESDAAAAGDGEADAAVAPNVVHAPPPMHPPTPMPMPVRQR